MLHIKCSQCGANLMGADIVIAPFKNCVDGVKYTDYATTCSICGNAVHYERYAQKAKENKDKAITKLAKKKSKNAPKITDEMQYNKIMLSVGMRAKEKASAYKENVIITRKEFERVFAELPPETQKFIYAYEDKQDVELLKKEYNKPTSHILDSSVLLLTQGIIELAIADQDEGFFMSNYGKSIVDTYNTMLALHMQHDYKITADLLLEKMRKGTIKFDTEDLRRHI